MNKPKLHIVTKRYLDFDEVMKWIDWNYSIDSEKFISYIVDYCGITYQNSEYELLPLSILINRNSDPSLKEIAEYIQIEFSEHLDEDGDLYVLISNF